MNNEMSQQHFHLWVAGLMKEGRLKPGTEIVVTITPGECEEVEVYRVFVISEIEYSAGYNGNIPSHYSLE